MKYEIVELKEKVIAGIMKKTTNKDYQSVKDIGEGWQDFYEKGIYAQIEHKANHKTIGLYTDYEGDYTEPYCFLACCEVQDVPEAIKDTSDRMEAHEVNSMIVKKKIEAGKYAKFIIEGDIHQAVGAFWETFWKECENMNFKRKYTFDFEEYQNNTEDMQHQEIHIYISVES